MRHQAAIESVIVRCRQTIANIIVLVKHGADLSKRSILAHKLAPARRVIHAENTVVFHPSPLRDNVGFQGNNVSGFLPAAQSRRNIGWKHRSTLRGSPDRQHFWDFALLQFSIISCWNTLGLLIVTKRCKSRDDFGLTIIPSRYIFNRHRTNLRQAVGQIVLSTLRLVIFSIF